MARTPRLIALVFAALTLAAPAGAFNARNNMTVTPLPNGDILVEYDNVPNETDYWCAAGDYAERALGLPIRTPLYRASPPPRKRGQGITFTLDAARASEKLGLSVFGAKGEKKNSISIGAATGSFCIDVRFLPRF